MHFSGDQNNSIPAFEARLKEILVVENKNGRYLQPENKPTRLAKDGSAAKTTKTSSELPPAVKMI
ncbi:unnamed protein product, partial [Allacma fusca]